MARPRKNAAGKTAAKSDTKANVKATRTRASAKASEKKAEAAKAEVEAAAEVKDVAPTVEAEAAKVETKVAPEVKVVETKAASEAEEKATPEKEEKVAKTARKAPGAKAALKLETKKDTTKAIETKAGVLQDASAETEVAPKKKPGRKPGKTVKPGKPGRKPGSKKTEVTTEMFLQFDGKEFTEKEIFAKVKEVWTKGLKNKVGDLKDVKIYLKPEESAAYFVVNGEVSGRVDL